MFLCILLVDLFGAELTSRALGQPRIETSPADPTLAPEREIAALKKEELELAERITRDFPDNANALILMGNVLERHGEAARALEFFEKALKLDPDRPSVYESIGWFYLHKAQYEEAIAYWRKALEVDPKSPGVHNDIARALMGLGRQTEAIEELEKDVEVSPRADMSYFLLGQMYSQRQEYEKARKNYEQAIAIQPKYTSAYYGLFTLCSRMKDKAKAQEYMATFRKLKAEDMQVLKDRNVASDDLVKMRKGAAETFMRAGQMCGAKGNGQRAEKLLTRAATLDPNNTECLNRLAYLYLTTNRVPRALQTYKKIGGITPEDPLCHLNIGVLSARLKQFTDAEQAFRKVIELAPQSSNGYRELAQLYLMTGRNLPYAVDLAEKAAALEPIAVNYFVLSWACDVNGDSKNALKAIERAIQLEPGNTRYKNVYEHIKNKH
jgi:tetratricopeptide (TPR) repeat protein